MLTVKIQMYNCQTFATEVLWNERCCSFVKIVIIKFFLLKKGDTFHIKNENTY